MSLGDEQSATKPLRGQPARAAACKASATAAKSRSLKTIRKRLDGLLTRLNARSKYPSSSGSTSSSSSSSSSSSDSTTTVLDYLVKPELAGDTRLAGLRAKLKDSPRLLYKSTANYLRSLRPNTAQCGGDGSQRCETALRRWDEAALLASIGPNSILKALLLDKQAMAAEAAGATFGDDCESEEGGGGSGDEAADASFLSAIVHGVDEIEASSSSSSSSSSSPGSNGERGAECGEQTFLVHSDESDVDDVNTKREQKDNQHDSIGIDKNKSSCQIKSYPRDHDIPQWLKEYCQESNATSPDLQWNMLTVDELRACDESIKRLFKQDVIKLVEKYEDYRSILHNSINQNTTPKF